jgi:hypothetical protein
LRVIAQWLCTGISTEIWGGSSLCSGTSSSGAGSYASPPRSASP